MREDHTFFKCTKMFRYKLKNRFWEVDFKCDYLHKRKNVRIPQILRSLDWFEKLYVPLWRHATGVAYCVTSRCRTSWYLLFVYDVTASYLIFQEPEEKPVKKEISYTEQQNKKVSKLIKIDCQQVKTTMVKCNNVKTIKLTNCENKTMQPIKLCKSIHKIKSRINICSSQRNL